MINKIFLSIFLVLLIHNVNAADYSYVKNRIAMLSEADEKTRVTIVQELGRLSSNANLIIPDLISILENEDSHKVKMEVIRALERIGGQANTTVPALIKALSDENWEIRWSAAGALISFGKKSAMAVPELIVLLRDPEEYVQNAALATLGKMGPISVAAMMDEVVKPLDYADDQFKMRIVCIRSLGALGAKAMISVPLLIENTEHENPLLRLEAALALRKIGGDDSMPGEIGWLAEPDEMVWPKGSQIEGNFLMFAEAKQMVLITIVNTLLKLTMDPDLQVQYAAVKGLANFGNKALPAKDKLINAMNRGTPEMRRVAIDVLANLGEEADDVIPDLVSALADFDANVQWAAIQALRKKGKKSVPELIYMLEYDDDSLTPNILRTFSELGPNAIAAVDNVLIMLQHSNADYRALAAEALGEIGEPSEIAIKSLNILKQDKNEYVSSSAEWALNELERIKDIRENNTNEE